MWLATENRFLTAAVPPLVIVVAAYLVTLVRARAGTADGENAAD